VDVHLLPVLQVVALLAVANAAPILASDLFGSRFSYPLDGHIRFLDGRPLFGSSKTIRGILSSVLGTSVLAPLIGVSWQDGFLLGSVTMAGDLFSSFAKRRLALPPKAKATGLDQIPESLFPLLALRKAFSLTVLDISAITCIFFVGEIVLSRWFFKLRLRDRPY
jgi:hypothetical protein